MIEEKINKMLNKIFEKRVFIVKNPFRKKKTDQYNIRVLAFDDVLKALQTLSKEKDKEIEELKEKEWKTFVKSLTYDEYLKIFFITKRDLLKLKKKHLGN